MGMMGGAAARAGARSVRSSASRTGCTLRRADTGPQGIASARTLVVTDSVCLQAACEHTRLPMRPDARRAGPGCNPGNGGSWHTARPTAPRGT
jgi:hypothetical protein